MKDSFVPPDFEVPIAFGWSVFRLEPLGVQHNDRDHAAWMSSIDHIRSTPGFSPREEPNWPVAMTLEENLQDLARHSEDFEQRRGFTYSILEGDEVIGCLYIYPSRLTGHDAEISSWVRVVVLTSTRRFGRHWLSGSTMNVLSSTRSTQEAPEPLNDLGLDRCRLSP